ncbi:winged helix-turn-helix domain-containing protein [Cedecea neteri]|uniref:winged helix-turn-helix domain-containing protein n=2 Tax=Cedecea neteri TaxID=158822 RepID=UPI002892E25B|nr:winged helix-turn-helix domain-containing protein [Cedecea neteri]WNJ78500.1 winged helix-turn-helix domain-containing protein [Cedecea neteri]
MEQCSSSDSYNYMINDEIIFNPEKRVLFRVDDETNVETLNTPTTKCFLLLISRNGIVDQATIYSYVWGENESMITPNNLYQNISLIRRALSKLSPGLNLIKTIPRIGFSIDTEIKIEKISSEKKWRQERDKGHNGASNEKMSSSNEVPVNSVKKTSLHRQIIISLFMLFAVVSIIFVSSTSRQSPYFLNYQALFNKDGCNIYTSIATKRDIKFVTDELMKRCETTPWHYVSYNNAFSDISVISCKNPLDDSNEKNDCRSAYFFMGGDA